MQPKFTMRTDGRVEVYKKEGGVYQVELADGPTYEGGILNIAGRAASVSNGATLALGGGDTTVIIEGFEDSRASDATLLAIGFSAEAILSR